jgi:hypothetical protein
MHLRALAGNYSVATTIASKDNIAAFRLIKGTERDNNASGSHIIMLYILEREPYSKIFF